MLNEHFFKILLGFIGMILIGIVSLFIISHFDKESANSNDQTPASSNALK